MVRQLQRDDDKSYKKTNFGPEETEDDIEFVLKALKRLGFTDDEITLVQGKDAFSKKVIFYHKLYICIKDCGIKVY